MAAMTSSVPADLLDRTSARGRGALAAVTLGSAMAMLDGTVVTIALRRIGTDLDATMGDLQWVVNGYLLALASLILVAGSLGDRLGRRRLYLFGIGWFAVASLACALAPTPTLLVLARVVQGIGAALMTPGALAIISASFRPQDRASAIGTWAGISGVATAIGPFLGGFLLDHGGWRWIFLINLPVAAAVIALCMRYVPESRDLTAAKVTDRGGAALTITGLAALTLGLIGGSNWPRFAAPLLVLVGVGLLVAFVAWERGRATPMVPMSLFASRVFSAANMMTFLVYGALGAVMLFLTLQLQVSAGFSPLASGLATMPVTIALLLLSAPLARLAERTGPRLPMALGPLLCAAGVVGLLGVGAGTGYWLGVLPGMVLFALGLAALVSPLTAAVLAAAPTRLAGVASGVNNAVARSGSLLAVAALPTLVGLTGSSYADPLALTPAYRLAMLACAGLLAAGGVVSWLGVPGRADVNALRALSRDCPINGVSGVHWVTGSRRPACGRRR